MRLPACNVSVSVYIVKERQQWNIQLFLISYNNNFSISINVEFDAIKYAL